MLWEERPVCMKSPISSPLRKGSKGPASFVAVEVQERLGVARTDHDIDKSVFYSWR
jgi:hypothetical protein